jgi:nucleotide-binding universal stress UspA family protein
VYNKIAIAYDGSREAERALSSSIALAKSFGAELLIVTALKDLPAYMGYAEAVDPAVAHLIDDDHTAAFEGIQRQASEKAAAAGLTVTEHLVDSSEVSHIVDLLREISADLLVLGLHRKSLYISRLWSTVYELAQDAPCNVLGVH